MNSGNIDITNQRMKWDTSYSVENPHIDRQHKIIISLINDISEGIQNKKAHEKIPDVLASLKDYSETHFIDEEEIMKQSKFPEYEAHRMLHKNFVAKVGDIITRYMEGTFDSKLLVVFLKNWWENHILGDDKKYVQYITDFVDFEINEAERAYSDIFNNDLKEIDLTDTQIRQLKGVALLFGENREKILDALLETESDIYRKYPVLRQGLETLLDDFIQCISKGNLTEYLDRNEVIGRKIAVQDIPYHIFMGSFHNFEESYQEILARNIIASDRKVFSTLDRLHHKTISILANQYFNVRDATVFALAKLADSRDPETGKHLLRTREYSKIIAMEMGRSNELIDSMYRMSPLHDIGKVGISDRILLKPGPLTEEEFNEMKEHVDIGGNTINAIIGGYKATKGYLRIAKEIATYHHEKYDGSGYKRLKGQQIPLSARVFIVSDIYDALTSKRCYKEAYTHERACSIIIEGDGRTKPKDFDPKVLSAFILRKDDFHKVHQQFMD